MVLTGVLAGLIALVTVYLGRRDVTRPAVAFGALWFSCIALAQLRLTEIETPWPTGFTVLAFAGGLCFMLAAALAGGTAGARGRVVLSRDEYLARRLVVAGLVLAAGGVIGMIYKAHVLGGVPLLSGNADALRANAFRGGEIVIPSWSSALTDGFFLGMWSILAAIWLLWGRASRLQLLGLGALAAGCLFGVALLASRNTILFAILVPLTAAYLHLRATRRITQATLAIATVAAIILVMGGLFVARLSEGEGRDRFLEREMDRQAQIVRPLVPFYINAVYPLEAASRVYRAVPKQVPYTFGGSSLTSLPDKAFPEGKPAIGGTFAALMESPVENAPTWSVATYQGRLYADAGWPGVLLGSALLGLLFGALYRWARAGSSLVRVALIGYLAYISAFMVYDNSLSFSLIPFYDLSVVALVELYARGGVRAKLVKLIEPRDESAPAGA